MALDDILQSIKEHAEKEKKEILDQAQQESERIKQEYAQKHKAKQEALINLAQQKANNKISQTKFQITSKINTEILKAKQNLIKNVFTEVLNEINKQSDTNKTTFWQPFFDNIPSKLKGELLVAPSDEKVLSQMAKKKAITVSNKKLNSKGGFQFHGDDIIIDFSIETILATIKNQKEIEIAKALLS